MFWGITWDFWGITWEKEEDELANAYTPLHLLGPTIKYVKAYFFTLQWKFACGSTKQHLPACSIAWPGDHGLHLYHSMKIKIIWLTQLKLGPPPSPFFSPRKWRWPTYWLHHLLNTIWAIRIWVHNIHTALKDVKRIPSSLQGLL